MADQSSPAPVNLGDDLNEAVEFTITNARAFAYAHGMTGPMAKAAPMSILALALGRMAADDAGGNPDNMMAGLQALVEQIGDAAGAQFERINAPAPAEAS